MAGWLHTELEFKPDIVVVAIGENVPSLDTEQSQNDFRTAYENLLTTFKNNGDPTIFTRSTFWANPVKDSLIQEATAAVGGIFVDQSTLCQNQLNFAYSDPGRTFRRPRSGRSPGRHWHESHCRFAVRRDGCPQCPGTECDGASVHRIARFPGLCMAKMAMISDLGGKISDCEGSRAICGTGTMDNRFPPIITNMMRHLRLNVLCWLALLALVPAGCGHRSADLIPVHGIVKLDGKPLAGVTVYLIPAGTTGQVARGRAAKTARSR